MRKLPWGVISVVAIAAAANIAVFTGCGSDEETPIADTDSGASSSGTTTSSGTTASSGVTSSSGTTSSSGDSGPQDGDIQDGQGCALAGQNCTAATASTCCSKVCNTATNTCAISVPDGGGGGCYAAGAACTAGTQCCNGSCIGGFCAATACKQDTPTAEACTANEQCCSGKCGTSGTGVCQPVAGGTGCRTEGNACTTNIQCCSGQCGSNGKCINVSFCQQTNDVCSADYECCGGKCNKAQGATTGRCETVSVSGGSCNPAGIVCTGIGCDNKCCSLSCGPYGTTGVNICQPPSGCKPQNELCAADKDCCGGPGQLPGQKSSGGLNTDLISCVINNNETLGRCESDQCLRPGTVCKATTGACGGTSNNCCESILPNGDLTPNGFCNSNPEACCSRDALGIPRCRGVNFVCDGGAVPAGQTCTTSADCCGKPCVAGKCGSTCVPKSGACTVTADCCSPEQCVFPAGSTTGICGGVIQPDGGVTPPPDSGTPPPDSGTPPPDSGVCSLYGQSCTTAANCCNGVPCNGGTCRFN